MAFVRGFFLCVGCFRLEVQTQTTEVRAFRGTPLFWLVLGKPRGTPKPFLGFPLGLICCPPAGHTVFRLLDFEKVGFIVWMDESLFWDKYRPPGAGFRP